MTCKGNKSKGICILGTVSKSQYIADTAGLIGLLDLLNNDIVRSVDEMG